MTSALARQLRRAPDVDGKQALATGFVDIAAGLVESDDDELLRTGVILKHLAVDDVPSTVAKARIAVLGTSTVGPAQAPLLGALAARGIAAHVELGDYDRLIAELLDPASPTLRGDETAIVLLPDGESVFRYAPVPFTAESVTAAVDGFIGELLGAIESLRSRSSTPIILPTLLLPPQRSAQLLDLPSRTRLHAAWHRANLRLLEAAETIPGVLTIDMGQVAAYTAAPATDLRLAAYARSFFTEPVLLGFAREVAAVVSALLGRTSKCLVLDLDGTTWGGVLADDGPLGVVSGSGRVGEAFAGVQDAARQLHAQGVVLAIASKNEDDDVRRTLREHDGVRVAVEDFAVIAANWEPKPGNIAAIAQTLNIGIDSLVFVDDNPSERGAVRAQHPQVRTVAADPDDPSSTVAALLRDGAFTTLRITDDDRARPERYRAETERVSFRASVGGVAEYLAGLQTALTVAPADDADVDRLSQLTLRTNQYNLTTQRLTPDAVREFISCPGSLVKTLRCTDRFGDHGLVGALFARLDGEQVTIVNFAMSCRVLGRGVESAALRVVLSDAADLGAEVAVGTFIRTAKNARAKDFFTAFGFTIDGEDRTETLGETTTFRRSLLSLPEPVPHLIVHTEKEKV